jgi:hypothetical protein
MGPAEWAKHKKLRATKHFGFLFVLPSEGNDKLNVAQEYKDDHHSQTAASR